MRPLSLPLTASGVPRRCLRGPQAAFHPGPSWGHDGAEHPPLPGASKPQEEPCWGPGTGYPGLTTVGPAGTWLQSCPALFEAALLGHPSAALAPLRWRHWAVPSADHDTFPCSSVLDSFREPWAACSAALTSCCLAFSYGANMSLWRWARGESDRHGVTSCSQA